MHDLTLYAVPAFVVLMLLELAATSAAHLRGYEWRDTAASLAMGVGNRVIVAALWGGVWLGAVALYEHRLVDLGSSWPVWVLCFVAEDFTYYVFHRASHEVRILWAAHENHHSSERYNLSTALRQSWTTPFTEILFYWWMPLAGFHPAMIVTAQAVSLFYQFWIHTEWIDRLPPWFERIFNTPSHHRVHHGSNVEYLDRNHGGILIVWDRLFGTFEPELAKVRYGLTKSVASFNPFTIAFHEYAAILRDLRGATTWRARLGHVFAPPGWSPDGSTLTSNQLRSDARASVTSAT